MARRGGIGPRGRQRIQEVLQQAQEDVRDEDTMLGSYMRAVSELGDVLQPTTIDNLPDLWPDTSNYGHGPFLSTRVHKHRFVLDDFSTEGVPTGTAYVQFKNLRKRKDGTEYERDTSGAVYAYYKLSYNDYVSFTNDSSKGRVINQWTKRGRDTYESLGKNNSIFTTPSTARFNPRSERYNPNAPYTPYQPTEE